MEVIIKLTTEEALEAAYQNNTLLEVGEIIASGFDMFTAGMGEKSLIEVNGIVYGFITKITHAGTNKETVFVLSTEPPPVEPPVAEFSGNTETTVGGFAAFIGTNELTDMGTASWRAAKDGEELVEFSTSYPNSAKFFPAEAGTYTIELYMENSAGNDAETKVGYLVVTEP